MANLRNRQKWMISMLHACLLLVLVFYWMNSSISYGKETVIIKWCAIIKQFILGKGESADPKDYLFVDVGYDKAVIPRADGVGNEIITDRAQLNRLLTIIKHYPKHARYTLCDIFLKGSSEDADSILQQTVSGMKKIIFPAHLNDDESLDMPDLQVPAALADYRLAGGEFIKFKLFQNDSIATVPIVMYEQMQGKHFTNFAGFRFMGLLPSLNSLIIDYQIRGYQLSQARNFTVVTLSELLMLPDNVIAEEYLKHRIVIIGDLQTDVHETIYGSTPGVLILLNTYLSLIDKRSLITPGWLIFLWISFTLLSRIMIFPGQDRSEERPEILKPLYKSAGWLILISVLSSFFWEKHVQILIIGIYLNVLRFLIEAVNGQWGWKQIKALLKDIKDTYFDIT